jgi:2-polyprenyl-3-methyl-5-hydroxy-6-metoxy-1,4-benzoquinol methylase
VINPETGGFDIATRCSLCGSGNIGPLVVRPDGEPVHECARCGFAFLARRPKAGGLAEVYNKGYFEASDTYEHYFEYAEAVSDLDYCPRVRRMEPVIADWRGKRVLEIGCAAGATLVVLRRRGAEVTGIEISEAACRVGLEKFGLEILNQPAEDAVFEPNSFDVVLLFDVLEHLVDPGAALERATQALAPGGYLALSVPNFDRFDKERLAWPGIQSYREHLNYFRERALTAWLEARGFRVVDMHTYTAGLSRGGKPTRHPWRRLRQRLRRAFPVLGWPMRLARRVGFAIRGPDPLDRRAQERRVTGRSPPSRGGFVVNATASRAPWIR